MTLKFEVRIVFSGALLMQSSTFEAVLPPYNGLLPVAPILRTLPALSPSIIAKVARVNHKLYNGRWIFLPLLCDPVTLPRGWGGGSTGQNVLS